MLRIVADNYVLPEKKEEFLKYAEQLVKETRKEDGNLSYHLHVDLKDECHLTFIEEWKDQDAIDAHNGSSHFQELVPKMAQCASKPGTCDIYAIMM